LAPECTARSSTQRNYLLLGDSHAAQLWLPLSAQFPGVHFMEATASGCFPTLRHRLTESARCVALIDAILQDLPREHLDQVWLVAKWKSDSLEQIGATLDWMKAQRVPVTLVGPTWVYDSPLPRLVITAMRSGDETLPARHLVAGQDVLDTRMAELADKHGVPYVSLLKLEQASTEPYPQLFDQEHFNSRGAQALVVRMREVYPTLAP
jgi:hypothetical protein